MQLLLFHISFILLSLYMTFNLIFYIYFLSFYTPFFLSFYIHFILSFYVDFLLLSFTIKFILSSFYIHLFNILFIIFHYPFFKYEIISKNWEAAFSSMDFDVEIGILIYWVEIVADRETSIYYQCLKKKELSLWQLYLFGWIFLLVALYINS